jgi:uncharacterized protein YfaA (DUF2138 family)
LVKLGAEEKVAQALTEHMAGAAGLCWYADSRLYTPLLVAGLSDKDSARLDGDLGKLFGSMVGAYEGKVDDHAFLVVEKQEGQSHQWQRQVSSNFGPYAAKDAEDPEAISGKAFMRQPGASRFDAAVLPRRQTGGQGPRHPRQALPADGRRVPKDLLMPVYFGPDAMAQLMQQETLDSLPQDMEPVFYNAAQTT